MALSEIDFENGAQNTAWSEEHERVPLKQRLKLLLASQRSSSVSDVKVERILAEKRGSEQCDSKSGCSEEERMIESVSREEKHGVNTGELGESNCQENLAHKCMNLTNSIAAAATPDKDSVDSSHQGLLLGKLPVAVKVEYADNGVESSTAINGSAICGIQAGKSEPQFCEKLLDELDHVALKERLKRLLTSKCLGLAPTMPKENPVETVKGLRNTDQRHALSGNPIHEIDRTLRKCSSRGTLSSLKAPQAVGRCLLGNRPTYPNSPRLQRNDTISSSERKCFKYASDGGRTLVSTGVRTTEGSDIPSLANIKVEPPCGMQSCNVTKVGQMSFNDLVLVKTEVDTASDEDELDHMLLRERMKLLSSSKVHNSNIYQNSECIGRMLPAASGCAPVVSKPTQLLKINRPRKRRKTVTDSVETAMEEDAPGLLKVLIEKGISVNKIKLYGEPESNEGLDDSSADDNFAELEEVIGKLFSQRESLLKLGPLRCNKGEKASYCLGCLLSLVEQAQYLQFRNWPVEWGWCRDLQSFIFVFERHNRIVLERPEYGYATYFFELEESLPINWQIKRLVIVMKLTSCSRITLIENKALMIGDDLTEGEARVLMEYGWAPNSGLGTMLNYYDRVVHDRKAEKESSEWRSKIGKFLTDGYNGGTITSSDIPRKVMEYNHSVEVKLELS